MSVRVVLLSSLPPFLNDRHSLLRMSPVLYASLTIFNSYLVPFAVHICRCQGIFSRYGWLLWVNFRIQVTLLFPLKWLVVLHTIRILQLKTAAIILFVLEKTTHRMVSVTSLHVFQNILIVLLVRAESNTWNNLNGVYSGTTIERCRYSGAKRNQSRLIRKRYTHPFKRNYFNAGYYYAYLIIEVFSKL